MDYLTVNDKSKASFVERKSEFIGHIAHVETNDEAVEFINSIKSQHRKARHNVYAYILRDGNTTRYTDDGEPQGTAGMPVLDVLRKEGLTDVCCVVTRYFGGILLGTGGLARAYSHSCKIAIESAKIMKMCSCFEAVATVEYTLYGKVSYILPEFEVKVIDTDYSDDVKIKMLVKSQHYEKLHKKLLDITNGQVVLSKSDEQYADFA